MASSRPPSPIYAVLGIAYLAVQFVVPIARAHPARTVPLASRFSWSMFANPTAGICTHTLEWRTHDGREEPFPLPPHSHAAYELLSARSAAEFANAAWVLTRYPDSDAEIATSFDDLLTRYVHTIDPAASHTLTSTLDCTSDPRVPFRRVLRLGGAR